MTDEDEKFEKLKESCRQHKNGDHDALLRLLGLIDQAGALRSDDEAGNESHQLLLPIITAGEQAVFHDVLYRTLFRHSLSHLVLDPPEEIVEVEPK